MHKPKIYYVNGTAVAKDGEHVFRGVKSGYGTDIHRLKELAEVVELVPDAKGFYYLQQEGCDLDYGENYLVASVGITAGGCKGQGGSIEEIASPIRSYYEYKENIKAIKDLSELWLDKGLDKKLLRLLYIGVCGEMEGYLSSTIIALVQGMREVFLSLRECEPSSRRSDEHMWRDKFVEVLGSYDYLRIKNRDSKERKIYDKLLGPEFGLSQELIDDIEWRNKMAHRVPFYSKPVYPRKYDVFSFIEQTDNLVDYIDKQVSQYKVYWLEELM